MSSAPSPRYPTPAELDAYARKTADSPLSIKIFPTNIRVPQHKQISRTVNGLDTTGQRYSPYAQPYSGGYQGLLAVVRTPTVNGGSGSSSKGVVKTAEGKRAKLSPAHIAVAPYAPPANSSAASRLRQKAYAVGHCKLPEASTIPGPPNVILAASVVPVSGGQSLPQLAPQSEIPVQSLLRHMGRPSHAAHAQGLQPLGEAQTSSPALQAATGTAGGAGVGGGGGGTNTACSDTGFALAAPPHSGLAYSGAVLPMQSADTATGGQYMDSVDYALWHHKQHKQQPQPPPHQQQQQHYHQGALRMYGANSGGGAVVSRSPETCIPQLAAFRSAGGSGSLERVGSSPLHCPAMHGEFSVGQFFAPPWNSVLATPDSDCYNSLELPLGSTMGLPHHPHHHHHHHPHPSQPHAHSQHYPADRGSLGLCCGGGTVGPPSRTLCHASVLSSSLQSLECLISEIHPPCIKERMLGRGYEAVGGSAVGMVGTRLFDPPPTHIQLPVFR